MDEICLDENGHDARESDWNAHCADDNGEDGERICCARALMIAADSLHRLLGDTQATQWPARDVRVALGVIAGIRAQQGCQREDESVDTNYLTSLMDLIIYG